MTEIQARLSSINTLVTAHIANQFRIINALNAAVIVIWAISLFGAWYSLGSWADDSSRVWLLEHQEQISWTK